MDFHKILNTLLFHWKFLIKTVVLTTILIFLLLYFVYPKTYSSPVSILPPDKNEVGNLSSLIAGGDFSNLISGNFNTTSQLYAEILKSRSAAEYVINKYKLLEYYDTDDMEIAVKDLQEDLDIVISKEGVIRLQVEVKTSLFPLWGDKKLKTRKLSADISNSFVEILDIINRAKLSSKAKNARRYIEEQITKTRVTLDSVESNLMSFQKTNKTISLPDQVKTSIEAASKIKSEIVKTEVEIGLARANFRDDNKTMISLNDKLDQLKVQYGKLEVGTPDYLLTFREVPELGKHLASLLREVKIQNEVYLLLQQQYYKEKIQENRDTPTIQILDKAVLPSKPVSPKLVLSSIMGVVFTFISVSMFVLYTEQKKGLLKNNV